VQSVGLRSLNSKGTDQIMADQQVLTRRAIEMIMAGQTQS